MSLKPEQGQDTLRRMQIVFGTYVMVMWKKSDCLYYIIIFNASFGNPSTSKSDCSIGEDITG